MKVIYCPPGEDPMALASAYRQQGGGGFLAQYWWVGAVAGFILIGLGQFGGGSDGAPRQPVAATPAATPEQVLVMGDGDDFAGFCHHPDGGLFPPGETVWLTDGETYTQARCDNGAWIEAGQ